MFSSFHFNAGTCKSYSRAVLLACLGMPFCLLISCKHTPAPKDFKGIVLPDLPVATSVLDVGESALFQQNEVELFAIDQDTYPTQIILQINGDSHTLQTNEWVIANDTLVYVNSLTTNRRTGMKGDSAQIRFHYLPKIWATRTGGNQEGIIFLPKTFREGELDFFPSGILNLVAVQSNDPLNTMDDSALVRLQYKGEDYSLTVREFSHTRFAGNLYLHAGEVFTGVRERDGRVQLSLVDSTSAFDGLASQETATFQVGETQLYGDWTATFDSIPAVSREALQGELLTPESYRLLLTVSNPEANSTQEFVLNQNQSIRWGTQEWMLVQATETSLELECFTYSTPKYPSAKRAESETAGNQSEPTVAVPPRWIEREFLLNSPLEFQGATFRITRLLRQDSTNLYDDQIELAITGNGLAQTLIIKEGTRQIVRGNNRWWIIQVKEVLAESDQGYALIRLESDQITRNN